MSQIVRSDSSIYGKIIDIFKKPGRFVEFGAYDGRTHSVTPRLIKRGWTGWFTEPVPENYRKCREFHAKRSGIVVDNVAIGANNGCLDMSVAGLISSGSPEFCEYSKTGAFKHLITGKTVRVEMVTLNRFFKKHGIPEGIELVVVDVEGMEWDALGGFDFERWCPQLLMVEIHRTLFDVPGVGDQYRRVEEHLLGMGYRIVFQTGVNTLFYGG